MENLADLNISMWHRISSHIILVMEAEEIFILHQMMEGMSEYQGGEIRLDISLEQHLEIILNYLQ